METVSRRGALSMLATVAASASVAGPANASAPGLSQAVAKAITEHKEHTLHRHQLACEAMALDEAHTFPPCRIQYGRDFDTKEPLYAYSAAKIEEVSRRLSIGPTMTARVEVKRREWLADLEAQYAARAAHKERCGITRAWALVEEGYERGVTLWDAFLALEPATVADFRAIIGHLKWFADVDDFDLADAKDAMARWAGEAPTAA